MKTFALPLAALALLAGAAAPHAALAQTAPQKAAAAARDVAHERLWLGSAWYPEQWPESAWEEDLRLM